MFPAASRVADHEASIEIVSESVIDPERRGIGDGSAVAAGPAAQPDGTHRRDVVRHGAVPLDTLLHAEMTEPIDCDHRAAIMIAEIRGKLGKVSRGIVLMETRRRSRSPFNRDRMNRTRSPLRRSPPPVLSRANNYRPRSRSPERRDSERYAASNYRRPSPRRDSLPPSAINSRSGSGRSSPRPSSRRGRDEPSRPQSPSRSPRVTSASTPVPMAPARDLVRETPREREVVRELNRETPNDTPRQSPRDDSREPPRQPPQESGPVVQARSPPRGPAAQRAPPTGPAATRTPSSAPPQGPQAAQMNRHTPTPTNAPRSDMPSPTVPPSGPRGYVAPRGGYPQRGRGGWAAMPPRHMPGTSVSPTILPVGPGGIPTGPRAAVGPTGTSPSLGSKPFNPPTGPAAHNVVQRPTLAQSLVSSMTPLLPVGKIDPTLVPQTTGVVKELEVHHRKLKEEEERIRDDLKTKQEKLRKYLRIWEKLERESKAFELKSDLSEKSLQNLAGEGLGGAAF